MQLIFILFYFFLAYNETLLNSKEFSRPSSTQISREICTTYREMDLKDSNAKLSNITSFTTAESVLRR